MEKTPYIFRAITHFSVGDVEKCHPKLDEIKRLTLEIGSKISGDKYQLVLIEPFPPFGRPGENLKKLTSLRVEDIDSVWVFPKPDDERSTRIEIRGKVPIFVNCDRIEGVPGWAENTCEVQSGDRAAKSTSR